MKTFYTILLILTATISAAQENRVAVEANFEGRHCRGDRGICSLQSIGKQEANATLYKTTENILTMEIFRNRLSPEQEIQLFGEAITPENQDRLVFEQPEAQSLLPELKSVLKIDEGIYNIAPGSYPATVTKERIFIRLSLR